MRAQLEVSTEGSSLCYVSGVHSLWHGPSGWTVLSAGSLSTEKRHPSRVRAARLLSQLASVWSLILNM